MGRVAFSDYRPKGGIRNPRMAYSVDDPNMAPLEELRDRSGPCNLTSVYLQALLIGAKVLLREGGDLEAVLDPRTLQPSSGGSPVGAQAQNPVVSRVVNAVPVAEPPSPRVVPDVPESKSIRVRSSAAAAQFDRFG